MSWCVFGMKNVLTQHFALMGGATTSALMKWYVRPPLKFFFQQLNQTSNSIAEPQLKHLKNPKKVYMLRELVSECTLRPESSGKVF